MLTPSLAFAVGNFGFSDFISKLVVSGFVG